MPRPCLDAPAADAPPWADALTSYDEAHLITYLRLLDADAAGAGWREVAYGWRELAPLIAARPA